MTQPTPLTFRDGAELHELKSGEFSYEFAADGPSAFYVWPPTFDVAIRLPVYEGEKGTEATAWALGGLRETPSLTPSIAADGGQRGTKCHGFVTGGQWVEC